MSKAAWCCSTTDGNAWFGDKYFDTEKWKRGWKYMATHVGLFSTNFTLQANKSGQILASTYFRRYA
jgi:hypothetical protein